MSLNFRLYFRLVQGSMQLLILHTWGTDDFNVITAVPSHVTGQVTEAAGLKPTVHQTTLSDVSITTGHWVSWANPHWLSCSAKY